VQTFGVPPQLPFVHTSVSVQALPSLHAVPFVFLPSGRQVALDPVQVSARSQSPTAARQTVLEDLKASAGHVLLGPVQVSATSQSPAAARQVAPALPARCWQALLVPLQVSVVQTLPSSAHAVPLDFFASTGQFGPLPGQFSARSHSPAAARQIVLEDLKALAGQVLLVPVQVSATSHTPAAARQVAPALPAGCWQMLLVPLHWSSVQGLASDVHGVPARVRASAGHAPLLPVQVSCGSHSPVDARQSVPDATLLHAVQLSDGWQDWQLFGAAFF